MDSSPPPSAQQSIDPAAATAGLAASATAASQQATEQQPFTLPNDLKADLDLVLAIAQPTEERRAQGGFVQKPRNISTLPAFVEPMPVQRRAPVGDVLPASRALNETEESAVKENASEFAQAVANGSHDRRLLASNAHFIKERRRLAKDIAGAGELTDWEAWVEATHAMRDKAAQYGPIAEVRRVMEVFGAYLNPKKAAVRAVWKRKDMTREAKKELGVAEKKKVDDEYTQLEGEFLLKLAETMDEEAALRHVFCERVAHLFPVE